MSPLYFPGIQASKPLKINGNLSFFGIRLLPDIVSIGTRFRKGKALINPTLFLIQMLFVGLLLTGCSEKKSSEVQGSDSGDRPNIILIVADDLGYSDLGAYGGEIETPSLDAMAEQGIRLSNMHNAGMCVISRSSMLTGQWWPKVGFGIESGTNLAQQLQQEGYRTGLVGKWHLKGEPNDKGFDYFFGFLGGYSSYFKGSPDYRINKEKYDDFGKLFYSTDAFTERAIEFVTLDADADAGAEADVNDRSDPFFLYLSYQAPHNPLQAPKEDIIKYRGSYLKGWQAVRDARIRKQQDLGIVGADTPLPDYPENLPDWESLSPAQKDLEDLRMSVYAAMVERMDTGIGKLMDTLKAKGQDKNTLIIFLSDNGTDSFSVMDSVLLEKGLLPGDVGSNFQPGTGWAYASVAPKRLYKISQHGGGVKTGAVAWWPVGIKNPGTIFSQNLHVVDIMPTILDITKVSLWDISNGETSNGEISNRDTSKEDANSGDIPNRHTSEIEETTYAGQSFQSVLQGKDWSRKSPMYFQFMDNRAIRTDGWSLVEVDGNGWELYNTEKDPLETLNLASANPLKVKELESDWLRWWKSESGEAAYDPESTAESPHYQPQGDRGSGSMYAPSAMPDSLKGNY